MENKDEKVMNMLQLILEQQSIKFNEVQSNSDAKFNMQNSIINNKFDELKSEIQELNKCLEKNNEIIRTSLNKLEQSVERMGVHVLDVYKRQIRNSSKSQK